MLGFLKNKELDFYEEKLLDFRMVERNIEAVSVAYQSTNDIHQLTDRSWVGIGIQHKGASID